MIAKPRAILIAGPTASGKSALALRLAKERGGVIINADSMQVYRDLRLLTARPSEADEHEAPHRLYGHVPGDEAYSAARFAKEAASEIACADGEGAIPIIIGGTGLYFRALLSGLSPVPEIRQDIRAHWRAEAERLGPAALHEVLASRDAVMAARLKPTDPQRITRALEVLDTTGRSLALWQEEPGTPVLEEEACERYVVSPPREELHRRCDLRFDLMMEGGALDEVRHLKSLNLDPGLPVMRALGVRPLLLHLEGKLDLDEAITQAKAETRQFAKRQVTWLRSNMNAWKSTDKQ